jgi:hypothetical protein
MQQKHLEKSCSVFGEYLVSTDIPCRKEGSYTSYVGTGGTFCLSITDIMAIIPSGIVKTWACATAVQVPASNTWKMEVQSTDSMQI